MKKYNVNKKNTFRLAYVIEQNEEHFDMRFWGADSGWNDLFGNDLRERIFDCGTTACIAGWCEILSGNDADFMSSSHECVANRFMLNDNDWIAGIYYERQKTHAEAVNMLRNLALTGVVDWDARLNPIQVLYARIRGAINI